MSGLFITLEGPEGSGKSTQAARLIEHLRGQGREVVCVREPGGTATGEAIRGIVLHGDAGEPIAPEAEVFLFEASRAQLVRMVIGPALDRGACVVCDRFADSTTAYQGHGRGFDVERILAMNAFAIGDCVPDITVLLDLDVAAGIERTRARDRHSGPDRFECEALAFHERVRAGFLELAARWPERFVVIPSDRDQDVVQADIRRAVGEAWVRPRRRV